MSRFLVFPESLACGRSDIRQGIIQVKKILVGMLGALLAPALAHAQTSPGWGNPPSPISPSHKIATSLDVVGEWHYQTIDENIPEDVGIEFKQDHQYLQFVRFPRNPELGNQVMMITGSYQLHGDMLTVSPVKVRVMGGSDPKRICGLTNRVCAKPPLIPVAVQVAMPDADTLQMAVGIGKRMR